MQFTSTAAITATATNVTTKSPKNAVAPNSAVYQRKPSNPHTGTCGSSRRLYRNITSLVLPGWYPLDDNVVASTGYDN